MAHKIKFGHIKGGTQGFSLQMGASEVLYAQSGRFVTPDGANRRGELADDGDSEVMGWVVSGDLICSSTEGATKLWCITDPTAEFNIPLAYDGSTYTVNYSDALKGETCDLIVGSGIQFANPTTSDDDVLVITGGKAASAVSTIGTLNDGYLTVKLNSKEMNPVGAAD